MMAIVAVVDVAVSFAVVVVADRSVVVVVVGNVGIDLTDRFDDRLLRNVWFWLAARRRGATADFLQIRGTLYSKSKQNGGTK